MAQTYSGVNVFINIAGQDYLPTDLNLTKMEVTDTDEGDSEICIECQDPAYDIIDSPAIKVGALMSVKWGYAAGPQSQIRSNYVLMKPAVHYSAEGTKVTIKAYTKSATLAARRPRKVYGATSVRQVVSEIANRNGLTLNITGGNERMPSFSMGSWSDRQTLRILADRYGYQVSYGSDAITFAPVDYGAAPKINLVYGRGESGNMFSASLNVDAHKSHGDSATTASSVDPFSKELKKATAQPADKTVAISAEDGHTWLTSATQTVVSSTVQELSPQDQAALPADLAQFLSTPDVGNLQSMATGEMLKKQKKKGELTIESVGFVNATCRIVVTVQGLAKRDSGNWYVQSVAHVITPEEGYQCKWELTRHGNNTRTGEPNKSPLNKQTPPGKPADTATPKVAIDAETGKTISD